MISISLPLPPTGLRAPGSPASTAPPGDFALALADMLTIAGAETSPLVLPAVPAGRQVAAVPGKSLPVAAAADAPLGGIHPDNDTESAAPETAPPPISPAPIATLSVTPTEKAPLAAVHRDTPGHDRTHSRRKEALAALPLPIPAAATAPLSPPKELVGAVAETAEAAQGAADESRPAAEPITAATPDQPPVPIPAMRLAPAPRMPADTVTAPRPKRSPAAVAASAPVSGRDNGEATAQAAPIAPLPSHAASLRPARFHDARVDADAPKLVAAPAGAPPLRTPAPVVTAAEPLAPGKPDKAGTAATGVLGNSAARAKPAMAAPASEIAQQQGPAPADDGGAPRRAAAHRVPAEAPPTMPEHLKTASPVLARAALTDRAAVNAGSRAGPDPRQAGAPAPARTMAAPGADAAHRRAARAPAGSGTRIDVAPPQAAQLSPRPAQLSPQNAARPTDMRDSAAPPAPAPAIRAPASPGAQPAPPTPPKDAAAPPAQDGARQVADNGATPAPIRPAAPGPRPIALAPAVPPAAAPIAAMFGAAQPLGARAPKPVERAEAPTGIPGALSTTHAAAHIQTIAEAQRTPIDMRRDDWTQKLIDRIETIRDAANAADTRIKLMPDALGKIDVAMRKDGDTVHVAFTADVPATRAMLADAQPRLAELAQQRGLRLGQASVDAGTSGDGQQRQAPAPSIPARPIRAAARDEAPTETGRVA